MPFTPKDGLSACGVLLRPWPEPIHALLALEGKQRDTQRGCPHFPPGLAAMQGSGTGLAQKPCFFFSPLWGSIWKLGARTCPSMGD